jgi:hypothetical protein
MRDSESLNRALEVLKKLGHTVTTNPGACVIDGVMHVPIDGKLRSAAALYEMVTPVDEDVYGFEARGHQCEVHIEFLYGEVVYQLHQDGKPLGERQSIPEDASPLDLVLRIAKDMQGTSLRRL